MAGSPVKPGNWGDWATIHSEASDYAHRQSGEYAEPIQIDACNLNGIECKYARNISYQIIVCQNSSSPAFGKKCPGHCHYLIVDWQHVNALIVGKPRLNCIHHRISGSNYYCVCRHEKSAQCVGCKHYLEATRKQGKPKGDTEINHTKKSKPVTDHSAFFREHDFWLSNSNQCEFDKKKLQTVQYTVRPSSSKKKTVTIKTCLECNRCFITEPFIKCLQGCGIKVKVNGHPQNESAFAEHRFYIHGGKNCPFDNTKYTHMTWVIGNGAKTVSYATCPTCHQHFISEQFLNALRKSNIPIDAYEIPSSDEE